MSLNVLLKLHAKILLKLGVMKTVPVIMRSAPMFLGGLDMELLKVEAIAQAIHHLLLLYFADTTAKLLLKMIIEYH